MNDTLHLHEASFPFLQISGSINQTVYPIFIRTQNPPNNLIQYFLKSNLLLQCVEDMF